MWRHYGIDHWFFQNFLHIGDFWCLAAVAFDLNERDVYQKYWLAGGDPKKFKWAAHDKGGTRKEHGIASLVRQAIQKGIVQRGRAYEVARAQGREIVFVDESGQAWTENGRPIKRTMDHFALPITYKDQNK